MMNSVKSARLNLVKFLFLLPLLIVLLLSFRQAQTRHSEHRTAVAAIQGTDTVPPPPPPLPNAPKKVDVKVKTPPPPNPPPMKPGVAVSQLSSDDAEGTQVSISMEPVAKISTDTKVIAKVEPKIETIATMKVDMQTTAIAKVNVTDLKTDTGIRPLTSVTTHLKPVTSVMKADLMQVTGGGGEELLVVKNSTTKQDIEQMKKDLESKGYEFTVQDASYSDGKIVSIDGTIRKGNDWGNFKASHFKKFVVSYSTENKPRFLVSVLQGSIVFTNNAE